MAFHRSLEKLEGRPAIPTLGGEDFEHLAFVIHRSPEVMCLAIDLHEHLVQVPSPLGIAMVLADAAFPDLRGKHRAEAVPPEPGQDFPGYGPGTKVCVAPGGA